MRIYWLFMRAVEPTQSKKWINNCLKRFIYSQKCISTSSFSQGATWETGTAVEARERKLIRSWLVQQEWLRCMQQGIIRTWFAIYVSQKNHNKHRITSTGHCDEGWMQHTSPLVLVSCRLLLICWMKTGGIKSFLHETAHNEICGRRWAFCSFGFRGKRQTFLISGWTLSLKYRHSSKSLQFVLQFLTTADDSVRKSSLEAVRAVSACAFVVIRHGFTQTRHVARSDGWQQLGGVLVHSTFTSDFIVTLWFLMWGCVFELDALF